MIEDYMNNYTNIISIVLFNGFKLFLFAAVGLLIISLLLLILGCIIKSQKIKSRFIGVVPSLIFGIIFLLFIPYIWLKLKSIF